MSFNYRVNKLGFLQTTQLLAEGSSNAGFHDQRLGLKWIQENIAAFGGNPKKVTIWGECENFPLYPKICLRDGDIDILTGRNFGVAAGAQSVGLHLHTYDGKDEGLYHACIMESGGPVGAALTPLSFYDGYVESLSMAMGCKGAQDVIECLRAVPFSTWQSTVTTGLIWNPCVFLKPNQSVTRRQNDSN